MVPHKQFYLIAHRNGISFSSSLNLCQSTLGSRPCEYPHLKAFTFSSNILWVKMNDNNICPFYNHFWSFSANCMFTFHKKEFQTVILRCLTGLNIDWFKNYSLRCKWRPRACLANFQNIATDKWTFYYHIWPFLPTVWLSFTKMRFRWSFWGA